MLFRKHEHNIPEKRYPHTEGDFSLAGLSFREKIRKMRQDPRGIEVGQLIWIVVGVLAATGIGVFIFTQVQDTGSTVESAGSTEPAIYNPNCNVSTFNPVARITGTAGTPGGTLGGTHPSNYIEYNLSRVITESGRNAEFQRNDPTAAQVGTSDLNMSTLRIYENGATIPPNEDSVGVVITALGGNFPLPAATAGNAAANTQFLFRTGRSMTGPEWNDSVTGNQLESAVIAINRADGCWRLAT